MQARGRRGDGASKDNGGRKEMARGKGEEERVASMGVGAVHED